MLIESEYLIVMLLHTQVYNVNLGEIDTCKKVKKFTLDGTEPRES
ncbi:hypothetical protein LOK49_LG03G03592 [Camellia lanceoleosa]|uniref:Uncharacterized protein n=1 Tax=Camellia lanceoleosa TaxID=1840588 RepID=A0ACC0IEE9_9ERIC|nr:hypothetical protein LOK49_LG03G03592 [Camellia lanceoleosa]